nr:hypothetical protein GCM10020092_091890 [Actinoplanes digitatis]
MFRFTGPPAGAARRRGTGRAGRSGARRRGDANHDQFAVGDLAGQVQGCDVHTRVGAARGTQGVRHAGTGRELHQPRLADLAADRDDNLSRAGGARCGTCGGRCVARERGVGGDGIDSGRSHRIHPGPRSPGQQRRDEHDDDRDGGQGPHSPPAGIEGARTAEHGADPKTFGTRGVVGKGPGIG